MGAELTDAAERDIRRLRKAMRWLPSEVRRDARTAARTAATEVMLPRIREAVASHPSPYVRASTVKAAAGEWPTVRVRGFLLTQGEFGAHHQNRRAYTGRRGSTRYRVVRRTKAQFLSFRETGWGVWPEFEAAAPATATRWLSLMTDALAERVDDDG